MNENAEITRYTDEWGEWEIPAPGVRLLIKPSQKWYDENKEKPDTTVPDEPDTDAITAEEALAILLGGEDE